MAKINKISLILICFLFSFFLLQMFVNISVFDYDDLNSTIDAYPIWKEENGRFVCNLISRIVCLHIPNFLGIHIQNWVNTAGAFVYLLIILGLVFSSARFSLLIDKENKNFYFLFFIVPMILFFEYLIVYTVNCTIMITFQYGYVLASVFGLLFLSYLYKTFVFDEVTDKKNICLYSILGFCAGNSSQIVCYSIAVAVVLLLIYKYICLKSENKSFKNFISDKNVYIPIVLFFVGLFVMVLCPGFWNEVSWRHSKSLQEVINNIIPFTKQLFEVLLYQKVYLLSILLLFSVNISIFWKKDRAYILKKIIPIFFILIGVFCYYCMTILGGSTYSPDLTLFWVHESFYTFYYKMVLSILIIYLISTIIYCIPNKKIKLVSVLTILFLIFYSANYSYKEWKPIVSGNIYSYFKYPERYMDIINELKEVRKSIWLSDKISFYELNKGEKLIKLPESIKSSNIYMMYLRYFNKAYKTKFSDIEILIVPDEEAIDYYYSLGGSEIRKKDLLYTDFGTPDKK